MEYKKIISYGKHINRFNYKDFTHDYLLKQYEKGNKVLDKENDFSATYYQQGLLWMSFDKKEKETTRREYETDSHVKKVVFNTSEYQMLLNQIDQCIEDNLNKSKIKDKELYKLIFSLYREGYLEREIAAKINVSQQTVWKKKKSILKWIEHLNPFKDYKTTKANMTHWTNPFNGNKLAVKKIITESQWNKRIDKEDFELDDENEYYKLFMHLESKEGLLVRLKEQKTNPYIK